MHSETAQLNNTEDLAEMGWAARRWWPQLLEGSTRSGDYEIRIPDGLGFTLEFRTVSGDLESSFPLVGPVNFRSGEAMYLDGGESRMVLTSVSGDLSLKHL